jgi:pyridoxal phosphate enzyme (YggS family)
LKLAQRIDRIAGERCSAETPPTTPPQLCLQVKLADDPNKSGWGVSELLEDLPQLDELVNVQIQGLLVIPPLGLETDEILTLFRNAQELKEKIQQQGFSNIRMDQLSMGMSNDYKLALQAGATMIRPGRVLFGDRSI